MNIMQKGMERYKDIERYAHIDVDAALHKVTQEVAELQFARTDESLGEQYSEAGDVLVNILSVAEELGVDLSRIQDTPETQLRDNILLHILGEWNTKVQGFRDIYSREQVEPEQLQEVTQRFVSTILNFTDPCVNLGGIIKTHTEKFMNRKDLYKPDINVKDFIAEYPDFPIPGVSFKDISPLLTNHDAMRYVCHEMAEKCRGADKVVGLDARGFLFLSTICGILGKDGIMARKPGKLPGETVSISYDLEYGSNTIEIQKYDKDGNLNILPGEKVAIIDDLLATGGTAGAAAALVEKLGGVVHHCAFVIGLDEKQLLEMDTRKELGKYPCSSVISYT